MPEDFVAALRARVGPMPAPWEQRALLPVGGLTEIGFGTATGAEWLLVVSGSGRSVLSMSGELVERDRDDSGDWQDPYRLTAHGIGPLARVAIPIAGLCGGGLARALVTAGASPGSRWIGRPSG